MVTKLKINEIFYSIQGEGKSAGLPTIFIRLNGCNFVHGCRWCDTRYANEEDFFELTIPDIISTVKKLTVKNSMVKSVCITGGEPLYQEEGLKLLVEQLYKRSYYIEVETNGSIEPPNWSSLVDCWSADIKCPSSGIKTSMGLKTLWLNTRSTDQVKFVVADKDDLNFVEKLLIDSGGSKKSFTPSIVISPCSTLPGDTFDPDLLKEVVEFCKTYNFRFSLQLHKIIWGSMKGV